MHNNTEKRLKFPSTLDKFKNDHLFLNPGGREELVGDSPSNSSTNTSSNSGPSNAVRFVNRFPNACRHWPDPPPPPVRAKKTVKSVTYKKRPGSADPRFHRHIGSIDRPKLNNVTQSEIIKKSPAESSTIQHVSESTPVACYKRQPSHVNEWLQLVDYDNTPVKDVIKVDSKFCQTETRNRSLSPMARNPIEKIKTESRGNQAVTSPRKRYQKEDSPRLSPDISDEEDYRETLHLLPNDVVHKYPDESTLFDYGDESVMSFGSDYTAKITRRSVGIGDDEIGGCLPIEKKTSKGSIGHRRNSSMIGNCLSHKLVFTHNIADSQTLIAQEEAPNFLKMFSDNTINLEAIGTDSVKKFFDKLSEKTTTGFTWTIVAVIIAYFIVWSFSYISALWVKLFGEVYAKPEETFVDKYVVGPFIEGPLYILEKMIEKLFYLLAMPVTR